VRKTQILTNKVQKHQTSKVLGSIRSNHNSESRISYSLLCKLGHKRCSIACLSD